MNKFIKTLHDHGLQNSDSLSRGQLTTLQVNMGNLCNLSCKHCHVEASPKGNKIMSREVIDEILAFLKKHHMKTLDITGGSPELNPHFEYFVEHARPLVEELIVRTNLTVLLEEEKGHLPEFFKKHRIHLIASLPCYSEENVDGQRGTHVFKRSMDVLEKLNAIGYARQKDLFLDLVYNPVGAALPPQQHKLEQDYRRVLSDEHNIHFGRLITIANIPIKRFKNFLQAKGEYEKYCSLLEENFNPDTVGSIMCRTFLSVGYDGRVYDCDFNQALGLCLKDSWRRDLMIGRVDPQALVGQEIILGEHCLGCTAGSGSSCQGALAVPTADQDVKEGVKEYYGKILKTKNDLKTSACCTSESLPKVHREILSKIQSEILDKFYGCGSPIPPALEGCTVLDLGCGTGRDVYLASYLVGEKGRVFGVDMTEEQLEVAQLHRDAQMKAFGFDRCNVDFRQGYIEDLRAAGLADDSVDVAISNCVINLSPDKCRVFAEVFRVLKEGGEIYFSDVFADRRIPDEIQNHPVFYGECLGGAMYIEDFRRMLREVGFPDYRIVKSHRIDLHNDEMKELAGNIKFYSMTVRAFKIPMLEDRCEDYGHVAYYSGGISGHPNEFVLDDHHIFETDKPMLVCGNTAAMVSQTRFGKYFRIEGSRARHFGLFSCGPRDDAASDKNGYPGGCC